VGEPASVRWVITVVFAAVMLTSLLRLVSLGRSTRPDSVPHRHEDFGHVVMAVSMIAMVLSWTRLLPTSLWVLLFAGQAVFFGALLLSGTTSPQHNWDETHHMVASVGMVYMVMAMGESGTGMPGMLGTSPLAGAFGVYFLIYAVWSALRAVRLMPAAVGVTPAGWSGLPLVLSRPLTVHGCRALMGGGMAYLLLTA
jgi:hypothetical protein